MKLLCKLLRKKKSTGVESILSISFLIWTSGERVRVTHSSEPELCPLTSSNCLSPVSASSLCPRILFFHFFSLVGKAGVGEGLAFDKCLTGGGSKGRQRLWINKWFSLLVESWWCGQRDVRLENNSRRYDSLGSEFIDLMWINQIRNHSWRGCWSDSSYARLSLGFWVHFLGWIPFPVGP